MKPTYEGLTLNQLAERNAEHVTTIEQLAAENAALKSKAAELVHEASEVYSAYNASITEPDGDFMDMQTLQEMQCVETPHTDAFLSRLRNEARAEIAAVMDGHAERYDALARQTQDFGVDNRYRYTAAMFRGVAKELREGKAGEVQS
ncbi:TPA: hypothetical protein HIQ84_001867 [Escherichia coli]|nr:hypothetical protein [Escherichia coli]HAH8847006.1 hypothetical protein [Escherichia coli]